MSTVLILGAGMVGVSSALALQECGHEVTLIDRRGPGQETSFGNAGFIQTEAVEPYAMPLALRDLARIGLGRSGDVRWTPGGVLAQARALLAYAGHSRSAQFARAVATYRRLIPASATAHAPWIAAAGADNLIRRDGYLEIHRTPAGMARAAVMADRFSRDYDVPAEVMDADALAAAEPDLRQRLAGAVLWGGTWTCADPGGLVAAYAALFVARGGQIVQGDAGDLARDGAGWRAAGVSAQHAVIALGPWSPGLCARFGLRVPMILKRGYHQHFQGAAPLNRPLVDADHGVVLTPMRAGLRICTAADLRRTPHPAPPQLARGLSAARGLLGVGDPAGPVWSGQRPCMPDMLPVVGAVPGQPGLWAHFGHGHQGFTLGPVTAAILAEAMDGGGWPELAPARLG
ncbi:MAG: FAD-dependent oxidoreductase [Paracoccus sp. (in: a-proteobacteria)]|uniref:NAD(P)/FAD-dependent oxidoreductase n=1 Tax=Paracoccus sp. TaxID=267 RepID=UPI0026DFB76D|nr:FAD-dependent oxidoreductase [Paracoccus sp. (in: a-proteobacteria)]MDO5631723.1 FAD-dependent oxidoreductase [Paracoccus sp. (in: a-proteobacteria)]